MLKYSNAKHTSKPSDSSQNVSIFCGKLYVAEMFQSSKQGTQSFFGNIKTKHTSDSFTLLLKLQMHSVSVTPQLAAVSEVFM